MLIKNGRVIDPVNDRDDVLDVLIEGGKIKEVAKSINKKAQKIYDAKERIVIPGIIDMHAHLREPGREDVETVASGTLAAALGGVTSLCCMPNTDPAIDSAENIGRLKDIINKNALVNTFIIGAITKNRAGKDLVDMKMMKKESVLALSDDGTCIQDSSFMLEAMKKASENNMLLVMHCENKTLSPGGVVNAGIIATKLGLRGMPKEAEFGIVKRDAELAKKTKARIHIAHVSCKESVDIIRQAKKEKIKITAEAAPHHFSLDENACVNYDTRMKMNPPLRSPEDVEAIKSGLKDGTIDIIASDHAPHGKHEKEIEFDNAAFGVIGLETSLALAMINLVDKKIISWKRLVELMSVNPANILGLKQKGNFSAGSDADITIIDPGKPWVYTKNMIKSKSKNSPFINKHFKGKAVCTIVGGNIVYSE